jgi:hypothetical protein
MKPFNRHTVKPGDLLCLTRDPRQQLRFKFMGHEGVVIATWVAETPGMPRDAILRQNQVCIVEVEAADAAR